MTYRKMCNISGECPSAKFCKSSILQKLKMCNDCPGCGCCMFCGEGLITTSDFPIFQYQSTNTNFPQKQNDDLFDLEKEVDKIHNEIDHEMAYQGLMLRTGMIGGGIPRISSQSYFKRN